MQQEHRASRHIHVIHHYTETTLASQGRVVHLDSPTVIKTEVLLLVRLR